jgi:hypothetical protein
MPVWHFGQTPLCRLCWQFELFNLTETGSGTLWNYFVHALLGSGTDMQLWREREDGPPDHLQFQRPMVGKQLEHNFGHDIKDDKF